MLSSSKALLGPSGLGLARMGGPRLLDVLGRGFATKDPQSTVESMKEAARRTGDAAKEWMTGASQHAGSAQEKIRQTAEGAYEAAKRGAGEVTREAHEAAASRGFSEAKGRAAQAVSSAKQKAQELGSQAAEAARVAVTGKEELASARAVWEASRDEGQQAEEQSSRKSQLTDEAHGDNPREGATRDDKKITETDFYTKA